MISWVLLNEWTYNEGKEEEKKIHQSSALYGLMKYIVDIRVKTWPCLWPIASDRSRTHYVQTYRISKRKRERINVLAWLHSVRLTLANGWFMKEENEEEERKKKDSYCTIGQYTIVFKVIELVRINYLHLHMLL